MEAMTGEYEIVTAFMGIGGQELILILLIVLVLFGARKIPELARGLGNGIREFRKAAKEINTDPANETNTENKTEKTFTSEQDNA